MNTRDKFMMCIGFVAFLGIGLVCSQNMQGDTASRDPVLSGMVFTENLLFEQNVTSKIGCASLCLKTDLCVTFTFTPVTSADDVCRGHSARMSSSHAHQASVGTNMYAFRDGVEKGPVVAEYWLDTVCTSDQDCSQPNSRCRLRKCTCTPGYYYSVSTKACLDSCSLEDLQATYLPFLGGVTYDGVGTELCCQTSLEQCRQACTDKSDCLNFEISESEGWCFLETASPRDKMNNYWQEDNAQWSHYQRNCR